MVLCESSQGVKIDTGHILFSGRHGNRQPPQQQKTQPTRRTFEKRVSSEFFLPEFLLVPLRGSSNFLGGWKRALKSKRPGRLRRFWPLERIKFRRSCWRGRGEGWWLVGEGSGGNSFSFSRWKLERAQLRTKYMSNKIWVFFLVVRGHSLWLARFLEKNVLSSILKSQSWPKQSC